MAQLFLAWEKTAFAELSALVPRDPSAAQAVIDLALRAAEDPAGIGFAPTENVDYLSVQGAGVFIVVTVDARIERVTVVAFGATT